MADAKPRCRLYLQVPAPLTAKLESQLAQALAKTSAACVLLCDDGQPADENHTDRLIDLVQGAGVACLIENDVVRAERLGADGVQIAADLEGYTSARKLLGESANIGVKCGLNRDDAMRLAEAGADYVAFGPDTGDIDEIGQSTELIRWWADIFVVPCVAWNVGNPGHAERLAALGADFIAPPRTIWEADDAASIIAAIDNAIRGVRSAA